MKYTIIKDEYKLNGGGLYAFFPYEKFDSYNKGMIKVGYAENFNNRADNSVHHYYPDGVYYLAFFQVDGNFKPKDISLKQYLSQLEKELFKKLVELGAQRYKATTRVNNERYTEWFYTSPTIIRKAFKYIDDIYEGKVVFDNSIQAINENGDKNITSNLKKYEGKYIYFL
jgi:hypothetical protein